jgi:hypothetical protein
MELSPNHTFDSSLLHALSLLNLLSLFSSLLVTISNDGHSPFSVTELSLCLSHSNSWLTWNSTGAQFQIQISDNPVVRYSSSTELELCPATDLESKSKSNSRYDWRSVSQYVLISSPFWFSWPDFFFLSDNCGYLDIWCPLWREDVSVIYSYNCSWALLEQSLSGRSLSELTTIFYCLIRDSMSKSKSCYDWRSVSQYVLVSRPFWNLWSDIIFCLKVAVLSLWREVGSASCQSPSAVFSPFSKKLI